MSEPYEELLNGKKVTRSSPGARHEQVCRRLHDSVATSLEQLSSTRLLATRSPVTLRANVRVCPDLALVTAATNKLWLAAEIVDSDDHRADTVIKKQIYEEIRLPRLWMIDPRYDNVEVYYAGEYGLMLKGILAGREVLTEALLPEFSLSVADLFRTKPG